MNTYQVNLDVLLGFVAKGDIHPSEAAEVIREMRSAGDNSHVRLEFDVNDTHSVYGVFERPADVSGYSWNYPETEWFWVVRTPYV